MNKDYAEPGLKMGLGGNPANPKTRSTASAPSMPERTAAWPGVPGKTQGNRSNGTPTTGHCGPFYVNKKGL